MLLLLFGRTFVDGSQPGLPPAVPGRLDCEERGEIPADADDVSDPRADGIPPTLGRRAMGEPFSSRG